MDYEDGFKVIGPSSFRFSYPNPSFSNLKMRLKSTS